MKRAVPIAVITALLISILVSAQPITGGGGGLAKVTHGASMDGSGTLGAPLDLRHDCGSGSTLRWSGSSWGCAGSATSGSGTSGVSVRWTGSATQANGAWFDDGTNATIGGNLTGSGNVTLGDASADAIAFNGSASTTLNMNAHDVSNVGTLTGATAQLTGNVSANGALINGGTAPALSSCGTSPTATKGPEIFTITVGTGTATTCTATFANAPLAAVPTCSVQSENSTLLNVYLSAKSVNAITISNVGGANMAGTVLDVICVGH